MAPATFAKLEVALLAAEPCMTRTGRLQRPFATAAAGIARSDGLAPARRHSLLSPLPSRRGIAARPVHPAQQQQPRHQQLAPPAALPEALSAAVSVSPARDIAAAALAVFGSVCLIKLCNTLERMDVIDQKLSRKLMHTLAGPGFLACWPLFGAEPYSRYIAMLVPALNGLRLLLVGNEIVKDKKAVMAMSRSGDPKELLRGPMYYVIVLMAISVLYWRTSPVGLIIASLMCGGDGLADIVGRRLGKGNPLPWNPQKSWAGSGAMFVGGLGMSLALISLFSGMGYFEVEMPAMALVVATIALVATIVESLPINQTVDDNLSVPGVAAFLGILFLQVAVEVL